MDNEQKQMRRRVLVLITIATIVFFALGLVFAVLHERIPQWRIEKIESLLDAGNSAAARRLAGRVDDEALRESYFARCDYLDAEAAFVAVGEPVAAVAVAGLGGTAHEGEAAGEVGVGALAEVAVEVEGGELVVGLRGGGLLVVFGGLFVFLALLVEAAELEGGGGVALLGELLELLLVLRSRQQGEHQEGEKCDFLHHQGWKFEGAKLQNNLQSRKFIFQAVIHIAVIQQYIEPLGQNHQNW